MFENSSKHLNMLSLLPCPLKVPMQSELKLFLEYLREEKNLPLNYCIESFFNDHLDYEDYLEYFEEADEIPDIIHIMPYFFYKTMKETKNIKVIWPEEGALSYPVSVLIKREKMEELQELTDYLLGPEIGRICSDAHFPAVHADKKYSP